MKPLRARLAFSSIVLASSLSQPLSAATFTWDGGGADAKATTAANWNPDVAPSGGAQTYVWGATSPIGTAINWDFSTGTNPSNWTFSSGALAYTFSGSTVQFITAGDALLNSSTNVQSISNTIQVFFNGSKNFNASTGDLSLAAVGFRPDSMTSGQTNTLTLTGASNGTISGTISDVAAFGTGLSRALTKTGTGTWTLNGVISTGATINASAGNLVIGGTGTNTFTGQINISNGNVIVKKSSALGSTAGVVSSGSGNNLGVLQFDSSAGSLSVAEPVSLNMRSSLVASNAIPMAPQINNLGGSTTLTGNITTLTGGAVAKIASDAGTLTLAGTLNAQGASPTASTRITTLQGSANGVITGPITQSTGITHRLDKFGTGTWTLSNANNTISGELRIVEGTISVASLADGGIASPIGLSGNAASNVQINGGTLLYNGSGHSTDRLFTVGANGATLDSSGSGPLVFTNTGSHATANGGGTGIQYSFANASSTIATNDSTAMRVGMTVGGVAGLPAGGTITAINHSTGIITLSAPTTAAAAVTATGTATGIFDRTLTLTGSNIAANEIAGVLSDSAGGGKLGITKSGNGTWKLSGTNTYTGATNVNSGTLAISGSTASTGTVNVASGASLNLTGSAGNVSVTGGTLSGEGTIAGNLDLAGTLVIDDTTTGGLAVTGNLTATGPVNVVFTSGTVTPGTYTIANAASVVNPGSLVANYHGASFNVTGGAVTLTVSGSIPLTWTGASSSTWDIGSAINWRDGASTPQNFLAGDPVSFTDTGSNPSISLVGDLRPASVTVSASTNNYSFGGTGAINGAATLSKSGSGTLTLTTANGYTGGTTVNNGRLRIGNDFALGTGSITFAGGAISSDGSTARTLVPSLILAGDTTFGDSTDNGSLTFSSPTVSLTGNRLLTVLSDTTIGGVIDDAFNGYGISKLGSGTLTLPGSNTISGTVTLTNGRLRVGSNTALGSGSIVLNGGVLSSNGTAARSLSNPITFAASTTLGDSTDTGTLNLSSDVALASNLSLTTLSTVNLSGVISEGFGLTKLGAGSLVLSGSNTYTGVTNVSAGTLFPASAYALGEEVIGNTVVASGAQLNFGSITTGTTVPEPITLNGSGDGSGALRIGASKSVTLSGPVTLASASTIKTDGGAVFNFSGGITGTDLDATFVLDGTAASSVSGGLSLGTGKLTKSSSSTLVLSGTNSYGNTEILGGTLQIGNQNSVSTLGTGTVLNNGALNLNRSDTAYVVSNLISGTGSVSVGQATGGNINAIVTLDASNTFTGNVGINSGSLRIKSAAALGGATKTISLTNGTAGKPCLRLDGSGGNIILPATTAFTTSNGDLTNPPILNEAGDNVINGSFNLTSGGGGTTLDLAGGTLTCNGNFAPSQTGRALFLDGVSGTTGTINGVIANGTTVNMPVSKYGSGTWVLAGADTYTGATNINEGKLLINGSRPLATGTVNVGDSNTGNGNSTLGGTGTLGGGITVNADGILDPGVTFGTLTAASVTGPAVDSGKIAVQIDGTSSDKLVVTGALNISNLSLDIAATGGGATQSVYVLASYGSLTGTAFSSVTGLPSGYAIDYAYNDGSSTNNIALVAAVTSTPYSTWAGTTHGLSGNDALPESDPDGDGVKNIVEFALNGNPTSGSSNGLSTTLIQDASSPTGNELTYTIAVRDGATFTAGAGGSQTATVDGVVYTIQGSVDLSGFSSTVSIVGAASDTAPGLPSLAGSAWEYRTFKLDASEGLAGKGFLRLKVETAP